MSPKLLAVGSKRVISSAKIAIITITSTTRPPPAPSGFWAQKRHSSCQRDGRGGATSSASAPLGCEIVAIPGSSPAVADARVEPRIDHIDEEIGESEDGDHQHHQRLRHGVVLVGDGFDEQLAQAVEIEDLLGDD